MKKIIMIMSYIILVSVFLWGCTALFSLKPEEQRQISTVNIVETSSENMYRVTPVDISDKILPSTKIIYQYYYKLTDKYDRQEELAPYFIIGLTRVQLKAIYEDWEINSFSEDEVVLSKTVYENEIFLVSVYDGFVAIFTDEDEKGPSLYDVTDIVVKALSVEDQQRLNEGIRVSSYTELYKLLEDYGS